jgi:uracil-DNA glycosylase
LPSLPCSFILYAGYPIAAPLCQIAQLWALTKPLASRLAKHMNAAASMVDSHLVASALRWWSDAGVTQLVDDTPMPWLDRGKKRAPRESIAPPAADEPLPATLAGLIDWLATTQELPVLGPVNHRFQPFGVPGSPIMVFTDFPDTDDATGLLTGKSGQLFDNMLAAIKLDRTKIYCAPLCAGRPVTGQIDPPSLPRLGEIARHHIRLAAPKVVWMLGQSTSRAILGTDAAAGQTKLLNINQDGSIVNAVASFHPRLLLQNPKRKAKVWADMQLLVGEIET